MGEGGIKTMFPALKLASELLQSIPCEYLVAGYQGIILGIWFSIMILILIDLHINKNHSWIITKINNYTRRHTHGN